MIKILNKSGAVVKQVDADTLRGAYLRGAYLNRWQGRNGNVGKRNN